MPDSPASSDAVHTRLLADLRSPSRSIWAPATGSPVWAVLLVIAIWLIWGMSLMADAADAAGTWPVTWRATMGGSALALAVVNIVAELIGRRRDADDLTPHP